MTGPLDPRSEGSIYFEAHADTSDVERELERGVRDAAEDAERDFNGIGEDIGEALGEGIEGSLKKQGKKQAKAIEDGLDGEEVRVRVRYKYIKDTLSGRIFRKAVYEEIGDGLEGAFENALKNAQRSKFLQGIGNLLGDVVGSVFNVSRRNPLIIMFLLPVLGTVVNFFVAILVSLKAIAAILLVLPTLLAAIGAQVAVVWVAFAGIAENVKAAFAATNAKELQEALRGLRPEAQKFVLALLPLKGLFSDLKAIIQTKFFEGIGTNISTLIKAMDPILRKGFWKISFDLGVFFRKIISFLSSPLFQQFMTLMFDQTSGWITNFGPAFVSFLEGVIAAAVRLTPFLEWFGTQFNAMFENIGRKLKEFAEDPETATWIERAKEIAGALFGFLGAAIDFVKRFVEALDEAGGQKTLDAMTTMLKELSAFFESEYGQKGLRGFIDLLVIFVQWLQTTIVMVFFIIAAIREFFLFLGEVYAWIRDRVKEFWRWISQSDVNIRALVTAFQNAARLIKEAFGNPLTFLRHIGRSLIQGLVDGITEALPGLLRAMNAAAVILVKPLPGSPAEEGPLSGSGYAYFRGQRMMQDLAAGIQSQSDYLSTVTSNTMGAINFGPGSIRVGFEGAMPTPEQARVTGSAVGSGILNQLAARNTRLAIRTL